MELGINAVWIIGSIFVAAIAVLGVLVMLGMTYEFVIQYKRAKARAAEANSENPKIAAYYWAKGYLTAINPSIDAESSAGAFSNWVEYSDLGDISEAFDRWLADSQPRQVAARSVMIDQLPKRVT